MEGIDKNMFYEVDSNSDRNDNVEDSDYEVSGILEKLKTTLDQQIDAPRPDPDLQFQHLFEGMTDKLTFLTLNLMIYEYLY